MLYFCGDDNEEERCCLFSKSECSSKKLFKEISLTPLQNNTFASRLSSVQANSSKVSTSFSSNFPVYVYWLLTRIIPIYSLQAFLKQVTTNGTLFIYVGQEGSNQKHMADTTVCGKLYETLLVSSLRFWSTCWLNVCVCVRENCFPDINECHNNYLTLHFTQRLGAQPCTSSHKFYTNKHSPDNVSR